MEAEIDSRLPSLVDGDKALQRAVRAVLANSKGRPAHEVWAALIRADGGVLTPRHAFAAHRGLHRLVYDLLAPNAVVRPVWSPTRAELDKSNAKILAKRLGVLHGNHDDTWIDRLREFSRSNRNEFWAAVVEQIQIPLASKPSRFIQEVGVEQGRFRYLPGAMLNIALACLGDQHKDPLRPALVFGSESQQRTWTLDDLRKRVNRVASSLSKPAYGLKVGDAVAVCLPMTAEAVSIYLGIILAGMAVVSVADSFSVDEISVRLQIANAKMVFTQDVIYRGDKQLPLYA